MVVHHRRTQHTPPSNVVKLSQPPLTTSGAGCEIDGDVDRFGRLVICKDGQWYAWYTAPNQPLV